MHPNFQFFKPWFEQQKTILDVLEGVMNAVDAFVAIMYNNKCYPGKVTEVIRIASLILLKNMYKSDKNKMQRFW